MTEPSKDEAADAARKNEAMADLRVFLEDAEAEATLVEHLIESISGTDGLVLAAFSGQNIDRLVTFYKAIKATRRSFVVDVYIAHLLRSLGRKSLPDPTSGALRVFLPRRHKIGIVRNQAFDRHCQTNWA